MSRALATIDGVTMPLESATVSVLDRGFLYGDSVFETLRTYSGAPFLLGRHLDRLARSAEIVGIAGVSSDVLGGEVRRTLAAADNVESVVRVTVTRGDGAFGLGPWLATRPRRFVLVTPFTPFPPEMYEDGIGAVTVRSGHAA